MDEWSTVADIGGGPMVVVLGEGEVEVDVAGRTPVIGPQFEAVRLDTRESLRLEGFERARPLNGCLGCSCGRCV